MRRPGRLSATVRHRGLRSPVSRGLTIGVDIGGTQVKAGVVDPEGRVLDRCTLPTPTHTPEATEQAIAGVVERLRARRTVRAVGIGAAGFVDETRSTVLFSPHLAWRLEPLRTRLEQRLGLRVIVENDANAAAWAEHRFGAAMGETSAVLVTLGTGIGGGIIRHGVLERGRHGMAGEFGHMTLVPRGRRCECGNRGCWEQYAGGGALAREARDFAASGTPLAGALLDAVGGDASQLTGRIVSECAEQGDAGAAGVLRETGEWLGMGLANLAAALDPGVIVVGGGVSSAGEALLGPARDTFAHALTGRGYRPSPRIELAALGNDAGFIGAADLARPQSRQAEGPSPLRRRALSRRRRAD